MPVPEERAKMANVLSLPHFRALDLIYVDPMGRIQVILRKFQSGGNAVAFYPVLQEGKGMN